MSEKKTPIKKVKLNYMSAVSRTPPKARIPVSSARMEELDKAIREKTKQIQTNSIWHVKIFKMML